MQLRRALIALLIAGAASAAGYTMAHWQALEGVFGAVELKTIDYRVRSAMKTNPDSVPVVLVLFDSEVIANLPYLVPFPRAVLADLINGVSAAGAKAIGLDVFLDRQYPELNRIDNGDAKLRAAIERAGNVVIGALTTGNDSARVLMAPDTFFSKVAAGVGSTDLPTPFETIRDGTLTVKTTDGLVPSLALALYAKARDIDLDSLLAETDRTGRLAVPGLPEKYALRNSAVQTVPIVFEGPPTKPGRGDGTFQAYAASGIQALVANGFALPFDLTGKIVLLGSGFHDSERFRSPFYDLRSEKDGVIFGYTYGVEVHANALQNLLSSRFAVPLSASLVWLLLLGTTTAIAVAIFQRGVKWGATVGVVLLVGEVILAIVAFQQMDLVIPIVAPGLAMVFSFLGSTSYVSVIEGAEKRMIKGAFGKYLSPRVVEELMADPSRLKLGGAKRHISMLFSDLAGFTSMSEVLEPEMLVKVLNEYLHEMAEIVKAEGGMVDKYIGDAVFAIYGAPNILADHALRSCRTALRMQTRLTELNTAWTEKGAAWPKLAVRIGINTGTPVVGNIGGEEKIEYTALGDSVNLAARLEPACKNYGVNIMIAQATRDEVRDAIQVRELDLLAVYGKKEPIRVYELLGIASDDLGETRRETLKLYAQGLEAFRRRDFELAMQYFRAALETDPGDGPSALYMERCEDYMDNPPPADWDFVERRQVK
jgi:class 3 adenylate cyclase/CHASE2 domain-containing sensor protein